MYVEKQRKKGNVCEGGERYTYTTNETFRTVAETIQQTLFYLVFTSFPTPDSEDSNMQGS